MLFAELSSLTYNWIFCPLTERNLVQLLMDAGKPRNFHASGHLVRNVRILASLCGSINAHWTKSGKLGVWWQRAILETLPGSVSSSFYIRNKDLTQYSIRLVRASYQA